MLCRNVARLGPDGQPQFAAGNLTTFRLSPNFERELVMGGSEAAGHLRTHALQQDAMRRGVTQALAPPDPEA